MALAHENLKAYRHTIDYIAWAQPLIDPIPSATSAKAQLENASTDIALKIATAYAVSSHSEYSKLLHSAHGSAVACAAYMDVLAARKLLGLEQLYEGKTMLQDIIQMLTSLLDAPETVTDEATPELSEDKESDSPDYEDDISLSLSAGI